jgi:hypothetical protein
MHVNIAKGVIMIRQRKLILPESVLHKVAALLFRIVIPARHENMRSFRRVVLYEVVFLYASSER